MLNFLLGVGIFLGFESIDFLPEVKLPTFEQCRKNHHKSVEERREWQKLYVFAGGWSLQQRLRKAESYENFWLLACNVRCSVIGYRYIGKDINDIWSLSKRIYFAQKLKEMIE